MTETNATLDRAASAHDRLLADFDARRPAALARAVSIVENHRAGFDALLAALHGRLGHARRSASPQHYVKIIIGEGNMGGNNVMIDNPVLEYKRDASEMQSFSDDFTVTGR